MDQTKQLIIVHDHLLHKLDRRGIWSPFAVITGLFASGISIAAMAEAHSAKTDINDLKERSSRIFHAHSLAINDHASQLSNLTKNQAFIAEQVRANNGFFYANRVKDHVMDFQDSVKDRNKAISDMISGHFPISTFSEELAVAASNLLKNIHDKGYSSIEDLKKMDFMSLPFSVSHHGDSRYVLHIHVPIFKNPTTDLMNVYEYMPLPWYLCDKHNNSVIATPVDPMGFNAIAIPDHDEKSDLHQIFNIQQILDCHRFKDIYMCPSTDIYAASHRDSCIASLYFADQLATAQQCELIPARYLSSASKINNFEFRLVIHKQTSFRIKDNRHSNPRTVTIPKGLYDVTIPEYGWIKSPNMVIQPAHVQPQATIRVIGHLPHEINDVLKSYGKLPEPFHQEDRKKLAKIIEQDKMTKIQPTVKVHEVMETHHAQYLLIAMSTTAVITVIGLAIFCIWANCKRRPQMPEPNHSPSPHHSQ